MNKQILKDKLINEIEDFFGIWKDFTSKENGALEEIQSRRERTLRTRINCTGRSVKDTNFKV